MPITGHHHSSRYGRVVPNVAGLGDSALLSRDDGAQCAVRSSPFPPPPGTHKQWWGGIQPTLRGLLDWAGSSFVEGHGSCEGALASFDDGLSGVSLHPWCSEILALRAVILLPLGSPEVRMEG